MEKEPLVSVIVPAYNYANFISETLQSIQEQTYINWEAIIVDDGSTDDTRQVVKTIVETDSRIKYIYQTNKGLPAARNTGIKASLGNYIQFLDADDLLSKSKIELQVKYMIENLSSDISYTTAHYFKIPDVNMLYSDINLGMVSWIPKINGSGNSVLEKLIDFNIMPVNCALIKRELIKKVGFQNETLKSLEDWEYWLRCAFNGATFNFVEDINAYALVRIHSSSMSQNKGNMLNSELFMRTIINNLLHKAEMAIISKQLLLNLNHYKIKKVFKLLLINDGIFNKEIIKKIYLETSIFEFITTYFKAINGVRKATGRKLIDSLINCISPIKIKVNL